MESHSHKHHNHEHCNHSHEHKADPTLVKDPVCGMMIDPNSAKGGSSVFQDQTYYFCNPKCKTKFDAAPLTYLEPKKETKSEVQNIEYTCPMHPEIRQIGPGSCPICGMALEPATFSADHPEDCTRRFSKGPFSPFSRSSGDRYQRPA